MTHPAVQLYELFFLNISALLKSFRETILTYVGYDIYTEYVFTHNWYSWVITPTNEKTSCLDLG